MEVEHAPFLKKRKKKKNHQTSIYPRKEGRKTCMKISIYESMLSLERKEEDIEGLIH